MEALAFILKEYGPVGLITLWFAWKARQTSVRISNLESWTRRVLLTQLRKNTRAIERNNNLFERLETLLTPSANGHVDKQKS